MSGTLYLVATPIGNLEDITQRALRVLGEVSLIACEDTRHTRILLNHYGIKTKTLSYHEHNERERAVELGALLESGASIAIVSDAGTPGINDPGFRLVNEAIRLGVRVVPVPGAVATRTYLAAPRASRRSSRAFFDADFL
jgi:16S rRNA (cytidine1402-2'-O)-methyltransferase